MSTQDQVGNHYPRIESITDSFGNRHEGTEKVGPLGAAHTTDVVLHPGDIVTFTCVGIDAQGRDLDFQSQTVGEGTLERVTSQAGNPATLTWTVSNLNVSQQTGFYIDCIATGTEFHRFQNPSCDDRVTFVYRVDPPV
jgi:hypothetical protein